MRKGALKTEPGHAQHPQERAELGEGVEEQRERRKICTRFEVEPLNWIEHLIAESDQ